MNNESDFWWGWFFKILAAAAGCLLIIPGRAIWYLAKKDECNISSTEAILAGVWTAWVASVWVIDQFIPLPAGSLVLPMLVGAIWVGIVVSNFMGGGSAESHKRGGQLSSAADLAKQLKVKGEDTRLNIGGVPVPIENEPLSFALCGGPGSGKSVTIKSNLARIRIRGDIAVIADPGGDSLQNFYMSGVGDKILNPFDARGESWSPFAEMAGPWDADRLAESIIPVGNSSAEEEWSSYARSLVSAVLRRLWEGGKANNEQLVHYLTIAKAGEIEELVRGLPAATIFDTGAAKMLSSVRGIIGTKLGAWSYLDPAAGHDAFSITRFLHSEIDNAAGHPDGAWLFLPYRADMRGTLSPLLGTWFDIAVAALLAKKPDLKRRVWFVADELPALGKVSKLRTAAAEGRKFGLSVIAGYQSISQLREIYGRDGTEALLQCMQNKLFLRSVDATTAEDCSAAIGKRDIVRTLTSTSKNDNGSTTSTSEQHTQEHVVLAAELQNLPACQGFLNLAGPWPVARVVLQREELDEIAEPFVPKTFSPAVPAGEKVEQETSPAPAPAPAEPAPSIIRLGGGE